MDIRCTKSDFRGCLDWQTCPRRWILSARVRSAAWWKLYGPGFKPNSPLMQPQKLLSVMSSFCHSALMDGVCPNDWCRYFFQLVRGKTKLYKQALRGNTWVRGDINLLATNSARNFSISLLNSRKNHKWWSTGTKPGCWRSNHLEAHCVCRMLGLIGVHGVIPWIGTHGVGQAGLENMGTSELQVFSLLDMSPSSRS